MECPSLRVVECIRKATRRTRRSNARLILPAILIFPIILSAACGRHKAQVKTPLPSKPAAAPAGKESQHKPAAPAPPQPSAEGNPYQNVGPQLPEAVIEPTVSDFDFSPGPLIRIGLATDAKEIRISSKTDYFVTEKKPEASPKLEHGEIQVRVEQEVDENSAVYRVQVASFTKMDPALDLKKKLSRKYRQPVFIHENGGSSFKYVWIGEFPSMEKARSFLKALVRSGYADAFVVREAVATEGGRSTLALRGPKSLFRLSGAGFLFQPSSRNSFIMIDGKPYRGLVEISLNKNGRITVVNQLGMEEYLLGVVPAEMSPSSYPEFAALAAQSIAARTYALNSMGRFSSDGFDLSNDTRTQVYEGVAAERDLTNEAVHKTSGLAIYYQDKLIDAMYMSTCGGRTEDYANVFDSAPVPYLVSVFCAVESGPEKGEAILQGKHDLEQIIWADDAIVANRNIEFARALGIMEAGLEMSPEFLGGPADRVEVMHWLAAALKIAQKTQSGAAARDLRTRAGFLQYAAEAFFGSAEIRRKISPRDVEYYMGNLRDGSAVPDSARATLCYLIQNGLWRPYPDNTVRPDEPVRRGDALSLLLRWVEFARPEILRKGTFVSAGSINEETGSSSSINVKSGSRTQEFRFSQNPYLFRLDPGRTTPVSSLKIIGNEKLHFHVNAQGNIDFLEIELSPTGASSDRYSPVATWDTTLTRPALAEKLRGLAGNIGEIKDLKPYKTGNSPRAVQIQIIGSRSSVVLLGYKVRNALNLKDTWFSLTREYNPDGSIASFTFHGRGYGHGVGLCQVGAFGMARAGRSYEEILKTYYTGVQIRKAY